MAMGLQRALDYRRRYFLVAGALVALPLLLAPLLSGVFDQADEPNVLTFGALGFELLAVVFFALYSFDQVRIEASLRSVRRPNVAESAKLERFAPRKLRAVNLIGAQGPPGTLEDLGRSLAWMAAALMVQPALVGLVLFTISGDTWRMLLFVPISALAAALYWRRIGGALAALERSDLLP